MLSLKTLVHSVNSTRSIRSAAEPILQFPNAADDTKGTRHKVFYFCISIHPSAILKWPFINRVKRINRFLNKLEAGQGGFSTTDREHTTKYQIYQSPQYQNRSGCPYSKQGCTCNNMLSGISIQASIFSLSHTHTLLASSISDAHAPCTRRHTLLHTDQRTWEGGAQF